MTDRVAVGLDIGNSTTEAVVGRLTTEGVEVIGAARAPTRRHKGSPESLAAGAALVRRLERLHAVHAEVVAVPPLRPVETTTVTVPPATAPTGRLRVVSTGSRTAGHQGYGVGPPLLVTASRAIPDGGRCVAVVPAGTGFAAVIDPLRRLAEQGRLAGVVLGEDEAVLVANRLAHDAPVVDEIDTDAVLGGRLVAVEVAAPGGLLRRLADPLRLVADLGLSGDERADAAQVAAALCDSSNAVVSLDARPAVSGQPVAGWITVDEGGARRLDFARGGAAIRAGRVGAAASYRLPGTEAEHAVDDLWTVDLAAVADTVLARAATSGSRAITLAALRADAPYADPGPALTRMLGIPARTCASEAHVTRLGALTTPGAEPAAVVIDLGAGTVDVVAPRGAVVAAGAGELLTVSVAALTNTSRAAAEWVKRGPASRVEGPQILLGEDGSRRFLDRPASPDAIGALVAPGPAGLLAFDRRLAPAEWRALRLRLKAEVLGANLARALRTLDVAPQTVVVVGGPAGDDEVLAALTRALPPGVVVGRGDAAGSLGHRYVVAYGLLLDLAGA